MHLKEKILKAYLDGELPEDKSHQLREHLKTCSRCQDNLDEIRARSSQVESRLNAMLSGYPSQPYSKNTILNIFYTRENKMKPTSNLRKLRPIWIGLAITIVFIITFSFQPVRAFASELLSLFRVQQISTVEIDISSLDQFTRTSTFTDTLGQVFADAVTITREKEEPQTGLDIETAKNAAGFALRFPKDQAPLDITLDTGIAFEIQMDASQIEEILASAGKEDLVLPESLKDSKIIVDIPASVTALYGNCTKSLNRGAEDCRLLVQIPSPTVQTSSGFDPVQLAEFGLQFLGMDPAEASSLSQSIDWKTTLVIPIPQGEAVNQDVAVDGVQGVLVKSADQEYGGNEYTLIWLKNDLIYAIFGYGDPAPALELADTLE